MEHLRLMNDYIITNITMGYFKKRTFKGGVPQNANIKKNNSIKRASQNKVYTKLILFKALLCYLTF